jgi:hypothetical protein
MSDPMREVDREMLRRDVRAFVMGVLARGPDVVTAAGLATALCDREPQRRALYDDVRLICAAVLADLYDDGWPPGEPETWPTEAEVLRAGGPRRLLAAIRRRERRR